MKINISDIKYDPSKRQRSDLGDISGLKESMKQYGLVNPITVAPDMVLIAGCRRIKAAIELGWTDIKALFTTELSAFDREVLELDENILRKEMTWQEEAIALYRLHQLRRSEPGWGFRKMQQCYGYTIGHYSEVMSVVEQLLACKGQSDELSTKLWNASSIKDATYILIQQRELEVRKHIDLLNAATEHPMLGSSLVHSVNKAEGEQPQQEDARIEIRIWDSILEYQAHASCALSTELIDSSLLDSELAGKTPAIIWLEGIRNWQEAYEDYRAATLTKPRPFPLIWARTNGHTWKGEPFCLNYWLGLYIPNGFESSETAPKLSSVINCTVPKDQKSLPVQVVQHSLDALCDDEAFVLLPGNDAPVVQVAQCGRIPMWDGTLESNKDKRRQLEEYYRTIHTNPVFI